MYFEFEKLDVYQAALEFIALVDQVVSQLPKGYAHRKTQLQRSADSIADNIAEGVGEYAANERRRFLRISRRSGLEAASQLLGHPAPEAGRGQVARPDTWGSASNCLHADETGI